MKVSPVEVALFRAAGETKRKTQWSQKWSFANVSQKRVLNI